MKDFPGVVIKPVLDTLTISVGNIFEALALGEEAANHTIHAFITASFATTKGVAIVEGGIEDLLHTGTVRKLHAIIHSDSGEHKHGVFTANGAEGTDYGGRGLVWQFADDLKAGFPLCQHKHGLFLTMGFTNDTVHFPMTRSGAGKNIPGTQFNTATAGGASTFGLFLPARFPSRLFQEMFVADSGENKTAIYVAVKSVRGEGFTPFPFQLVYDDVRGLAGKDFIFEVADKVPVVSNFERATFSRILVVCMGLGFLSGVDLNFCPHVIPDVSAASFQFAGYGALMHFKVKRYFIVLRAFVVHLLYHTPIIPGQIAFLSRHVLTSLSVSAAGAGGPCCGRGRVLPFRGTGDAVVDACGHGTGAGDGGPVKL